MPRTVLVADDSQIIQKVIRLALKDQDVEVVTVASGTEAIERIERAPPAIVLADTRMPGQNGYEVGEFVKAAPERSDIPVILMTGAFEPVDDARAQAVSDAILVKPFEPDRLVATVREFLSNRPAASQVAHAPHDARVADDQPAAPVLPARPAVAPGVTPATTSALPVVPEPEVAGPPRAFQPAESSLDVTDDLVDRLASRVIARLSDRVIRETTTEIVTEVAERVVREEIERLKEKLR